MNGTLQHILVGIDFSESSQMALLHALQLAERLHARLHLAHIAPGEGVTAPVNLGLDISEQFPAAREARKHLEWMKALIGREADIEIHLRMGNPLEGLLALIHELKPAMVIVCSQNKRQIQRALLGSVSNRLVQRSPVPVLVAPTPGREAILAQPEPPAEPELPSVGRAVTDSHGIQTAEGGIAGSSGTDVY